MSGMEKVAWINLLYDFYGQLLTDRQQRFIELYYAHDLSLSEIAEQFNISRQAVHDVIKRAESVLMVYEEKLGLVTKFMEQRERLSEALKLLQQEPSLVGNIKLDRVREIMAEVIEIVRK